MSQALFSASTSLADPQGSAPLVAAIHWLQATLLGTIATTVAVIAIAWVGVAMLSGRISLRRGATVVLGCFILFGAAGIAGGIRSAALNAAPPGLPEAEASPSPPMIIPPPKHAQYDPYAGAAVPQR